MPFPCAQAYTSLISASGVGSLAPRTVAIPFGPNIADDAQGLHERIRGGSMTVIGFRYYLNAYFRYH